MGPYTIMGLAWLGCAIWIAIIIFTNKTAHPKALFYLFFVEMWERFSYYGMRALLVLYMINGFMSYEATEAYGVYGAYGAMVYATPLLGGLLAERFMGYRKAITWGAILMMLGHFLMAFENKVIFFTALTLLIMGNGFFKPNISSMIGKFYARNDPRRDGAFTIFYMGINIGAFLTGLTCGVVGELEGWHYGFTLAGVGMLAGLIIFKMAERNGVLGDQGYAPYEVEEVDQSHIPEDERIEKFNLIQGAAPGKTGGISNNILIYIGSILALPIAWILIDHNDVLDWVLLAVGIGMVAYLIITSFKYEIVQRQRIWVVVLLFFFAMIFWTFFELAGSALTIFTDNNISKGGLITTTMFQSLNPFFIMLFAPVYSWLWIKLAKSNMEPNAAVKFGIALILLGLGFIVLNFGKGMAVAGMIPAMFMVMLYLLHTLGELALSPVGLSLVTKLSPVKIIGFVMGFWMMSSSFAHMLGKHVANYTSIDKSAIVSSSEFKDALTDKDIITAMQDDKFTCYILTSKEKKALKKSDTGKYNICIEGKTDEGEDKLTKDKKTVQKAINTDAFAQSFSKVKGENYAVVKLYDKEIYAKVEEAKTQVNKDNLLAEATTTLVTNNQNLLSRQGEIIMSANEIKGFSDTAINKQINGAVAQKTLGLSLSVFRMLGFIAIGGGLFLMLISPIVGRWMHGIK